MVVPTAWCPDALTDAGDVPFDVHVPVNAPTCTIAIAQNPVLTGIILLQPDDLVVGRNATISARLVFGEDASGVVIPTTPRANSRGYGTVTCRWRLSLIWSTGRYCILGTSDKSPVGQYIGFVVVHCAATVCAGIRLDGFYDSRRVRLVLPGSVVMVHMGVEALA